MPILLVHSGRWRTCAHINLAEGVGFEAEVRTRRPPSVGSHQTNTEKWAFVVHVGLYTSIHPKAVAMIGCNSELLPRDRFAKPSSRLSTRRSASDSAMASGPASHGRPSIDLVELRGRGPTRAGGEDEKIWIAPPIDRPPPFALADLRKTFSPSYSRQLGN